MSKTLKVYIYFLVKKDNIPFYIGYTRKISSRINHHRKVHGIDTEIEILDYVCVTSKKFWEMHYISLFKSWGFKLKNKNNGGGGPISWSEETKNKYKKWRLGKTPSLGIKQSKETRKRKSIALKGKPKPVGFGDIMRKTRIGIPKPEGTGAKISLALKGKPSKKSKVVMQFDLQGKFIQEYPNTLIASLKTNSNSSSISKVCRGIFKQTNNYIWKYKIL